MGKVICLSPVDYSRVLGVWRECPPWRSFYGVLACIYANFGENHEELQTVGSREEKRNVISSFLIPDENYFQKLMFMLEYKDDDDTFEIWYRDTREGF